MLAAAASSEGRGTSAREALHRARLAARRARRERRAATAETSAAAEAAAAEASGCGAGTRWPGWPSARWASASSSGPWRRGGGRLAVGCASVCGFAWAWAWACVEVGGVACGEVVCMFR